MIKLFKYLKPYKWAVILAPLFMLLEVLMDLMQPRFMEKIIDIGLKRGDIGYILRTGLIMILAALIGMVGGGGCVVFSSIASQNFAYDLRSELFKKVMAFSFKNVDRFRPETLITRLTNDVVQIQNVVMMMLRIVVRAPLLFIGGIIMTLTIDPKLSLVLFVSIPFVILIFYFMIKFSFPLFSQLQKRIDRVNAVMRENLLGSRVVKAFVRHEHEQKRFYDANQNLLQTSLKAFGVVVITMPLFGFVMNMAMVGVVWFGGFEVKYGHLQVGQLMAFINYTMQILFSLMMIGNIFLFITRASASAERINEVLDCSIDVKSKENAIKKPIEFGKVEFRNVTFYYNQDEESPALENISFVANPGEIVGIIGTTGSGKSTLVSLIPRLYDVQEGEVLIDDINVKDYDVEVLRKSISIVLQDTILFTGSIKENIAWGNENATMEEIIQAAKAAQAHHFIMSFEKGYDTEVSERGVNLSGGQKQRISIARAILKKPKILILDDCTSAVDMATEKKIQAALKEYMRGTTTFIIAQRISSIKHADKIIVMDAGRIVAIGTHDELVKNCPIYREIYLTQTGEEEGKIA
ncbi:ABC transporter related protein [Caldicellulosiruptor kronotskyensis 2002]|uniref:ABC transporter related protein n=1 Tax=Caldicellulosiruptor kronotskyensis (strain DSM 18902 / VKM B-2412 / 2002) TaxID=632348 RepID=E4SHN9_CALK2|nr:ABC transporter ATP-binding protein [Caldicellulosiruptor kronotskyensis]ADQ47264.1 ABC transporter related protein [Caldicellulosiruptor kronotskyensis 2002]